MEEAEQGLDRLRRSLANREAELAEVEALLHTIGTMRREPDKPLRTSVEVGEGLRVSAVVDPPHERVHVHLGLGVFVELPLDSAAMLCGARRELLLRKLRLLDEQRTIVAGPSA